jgi:hypothetical protein
MPTSSVLPVALLPRPANQAPAPTAITTTLRRNPNHQALRALANRLVGIVHDRLRHQHSIDQHAACRGADQPPARRIWH